MQAVLDELFCWIALTALTTAADSSPIMAWWGRDIGPSVVSLATNRRYSGLSILQVFERTSNAAAFV